MIGFIAKHKRVLLGLIYYLSLGYFTYLMALITLQYIPIDFEVAFLNIKVAEIQLRHYQIAFFCHVYTSILVLVVGITQFSKLLRRRFSQWHKQLGKVYIFLILFVASPSGLIMAYYANGGFYSQVSFTIQAILWFSFTYLAYRHILKKAYRKHQDFMLRSYALTLSAISLRLLKWGIVSTLALPPMDTYRIVSWLGWLLNLFLIEIYIYRKNKANVSYL